MFVVALLFALFLMIYLYTVWDLQANDYKTSRLIIHNLKRIYFIMAIIAIVYFLYLLFLIFINQSRIANDRMLALISIILSIYQMVYALINLKEGKFRTILLWVLAVYTYAVLFAQFNVDKDDLIGGLLTYENIIFMVSIVISSVTTIFLMFKSAFIKKSKKSAYELWNSAGNDYY